METIAKLIVPEHMKYHHAKRDGSAELPYKELSELPAKIEEWLAR